MCNHLLRVSIVWDEDIGTYWLRVSIVWDEGIGTYWLRVSIGWDEGLQSCHQPRCIRTQPAASAQNKNLA